MKLYRLLWLAPLCVAAPAQAAYVSLDSGKVVAIYGVAQNDPAPEGYAVIADDDARIATFLSVQAVPGQLQARLDAGLTVTSTATPALTAIYSLSTTAQRDISGVAAGIASRGRLPGGGTTFLYQDLAGVPHEFTSDQFLAFASAVEDYVYGLTTTAAALAAGQPATWQDATATIP